MKQVFSPFTFVILFFLNTLQNVKAQDAYYIWLNTELQKNSLTGGTYLFGGTTEINTLNGISGSSIRSLKVVTGQIFTQSVEINVPTYPSNSNFWDSNMKLRNKVAIKKGDVLLLTFFIRCNYAADATGKCDASVSFKQDDNNDWFWSRPLKASQEWRQYYIPYTAERDFVIYNLKVEFFFMYKVQKIEMGGFALINYSNKYPINKLPRTLEEINYPGREANAPWRIEAEKRIEQLRKGEMKLMVKDKEGNPLTNASVDIRMKKHSFLWGTAIGADLFVQNDQNAQRYRHEFLRLFNFAVIENHLKWQTWSWKDSRPATLKTIDFLKENNIPYRGHNMIWPRREVSPGHLVALMDAKPVDTLKIEELCMQHIDSIVDFVKDYPPRDWDVVNETSMEHFTAFMNYNVFARFYKKAKNTCPPGTKLYINEACPEAYYFKYMDMLKKEGVEVDGIGIQGHYNYEMVDNPIKILTQLDSLYKTYNKELLISEFDYNITNNIDFCEPELDSLAADFTRDLLIASFSHPSMNSFMMWGFWNGAHWLKNAPIFRSDWSLRPAGKVYIDLVLNKWFTKLKSTTDSLGNTNFRGFLGDYDIAVTYNGVTKVVNTTLPSDGASLDIVFDDTVIIAPTPVLKILAKGTSSVILGWEPDTAIAYYNIYQNDSIIAGNILANQFTVLALEPEILYSFKISGVDKQGYTTHLSNEVNCQTFGDYYSVLTTQLKNNPNNYVSPKYIIGGNESTVFAIKGSSFSTGTWTDIAINDTIFTIAKRVTVSTKPTNFWDILLHIRNQTEVKKGDKLKLIFFVRAIPYNSVSTCQGYIALKEVDSNNQIMGADFSAGTNWKRFEHNYTATASHAIEKLKLEIFAGHKIQSFEIAGLALVKDDIIANAADIKLNPFLVYPNPVENYISIRFPEDLEVSKVTLNLYTLQGTSLLQKQINNNETVDISYIPKGIYFLKLQFDKTSITKKILKI